MCYPWEESYPLGRRTVQTANALQRRLPFLASQMQIRAASFPPQRVPIGYRVPLHPGRRQGLEAGHHHQADPVRNPGTPQ